MCRWFIVAAELSIALGASRFYVSSMNASEWMTLGTLPMNKIKFRVFGWPLAFAESPPPDTVYELTVVR